SAATSSWAEWESLLLGRLLRPLLDLLDDGGVGERCGVSQVATLSHVLEEPAHDLAAARLGKIVGEDDRLRTPELADLLGHVLSKLLAPLVGRVDAPAQGDVGDDRLTRGLVLSADARGLGHVLVVDERRLDLGRRDAVTGDVHHVVDTTQQPEVAVVVDLAAVAREVAALEARPVRLLVALGIAVDASEHPRPRAGQREVAAAPFDLVALLVDHLGTDAGQWEGRRAGLEGGGARQRRDHDAAGLGLPPRVDDRAAAGADVLPVPDPRLG